MFRASAAGGAGGTRSRQHRVIERVIVVRSVVYGRGPAVRRPAGPHARRAGAAVRDARRCRLNVAHFQRLAREAARVIVHQHAVRVLDHVEQLGCCGAHNEEVALRRGVSADRIAQPPRGARTVPLTPSAFFFCL